MCLMQNTIRVFFNDPYTPMQIKYIQRKKNVGNSTYSGKKKFDCTQTVGHAETRYRVMGQKCVHRQEAEKGILFFFLHRR